MNKGQLECGNCRRDPTYMFSITKIQVLTNTQQKLITLMNTYPSVENPWLILSKLVSAGSRHNRRSWQLQAQACVVTNSCEAGKIVGSACGCTGACTAYYVFE